MKAHDIGRQLTYPERIESRPYRLSLAARSPGQYRWRPPTNVFQTDAGMIVQVEVAGLGRGDFDVDVGERHLTISGVRRLDTAFGPRTACQQVEIAGGHFATEVDVPWKADPSAVETSYRDGFIVVRVSKSQA